MASPRVKGARIYLNEDELEAIRAYKEENGLSESAAMRQLILKGLKDDPANELARRLSDEMRKPGVRRHYPRLYSA